MHQSKTKPSFPTTIAATCLVAALAACSHEDQSKTATTPSQGTAQPQQPSMAEQYGSAMGQPGPSNEPSEMHQPSMEPGNAQPPAANGAPEQGTTSGQQPMQEQPSTTTVDVSSLNDAQIAAVLNAVNGDQIKEAQLAGNSASMPQVRQYARQVLVTHQALQARLDSVYAQMQISPSPNAVSNQVESDGQNRVSALESLRGKDFDRVFMDDQVRSHNNALELLDRSIPNVQDKRLKTQLTDARTRVEAQLRKAEVLQQQVQQGAANRQGAPHQHGTVNVAPGAEPGVVH
jgi:putative membrane protein